MLTRLLLIDPDQDATLLLARALRSAAKHITIDIASNKAGVMKAATNSQPIHAVFIPAAQYNFLTLLPLLEAGHCFELVLLLGPNERYHHHLSFHFPLSLRPPYTATELSSLLNTLLQVQPAHKDYAFLLLKIDWLYTKLPLCQIKRIERKGSYTRILMQDGTKHDSFYSINRLMQLLPEGNFIQLSRGMILSYQSLKKTKKFLLLDGVPYPIKGFLKKQLGLTRNVQESAPLVHITRVNQVPQTA